VRIKVSIYAEKVPIIFRNRVMSLIKESLSKSNKSYFNSLYSTKKPKASTFNLVFNRSNPVDEEIYIDDAFRIRDKVFYQDANNPISLYISSDDYEFIINIINGIREIKTFEFSKENYWKIDKISILKEKTIYSNVAVFRTNSPVIVEDKNDSPVIFSDKNFQAELNNIMETAFKKIYGRSLRQPLEFYPIEMEKEVVKHTLRDFRKKTGKPIMYLTGSNGIFKLKGYPEDLQAVYQIGLGNRRNQGFGMIDVISERVRR
jgi:CRISPR-associated endoribonuclease Cas6